MKVLAPLILSLIFVQCQRTHELSAFPVVNKVKTGAELKIILPENHRDGATWHLDQDFDKKLIEQVKEVWHGPEKGIYYHLRSKKEGSIILRFVKRHYTDTLDKVIFIIEASQ